MWPDPGSNRGPFTFQANALPTELSGREALGFTATLTRLELATSAVTGRRANQLRHRAVCYRTSGNYTQRLTWAQITTNTGSSYQVKRIFLGYTEHLAKQGLYADQRPLGAGLAKVCRNHLKRTVSENYSQRVTISISFRGHPGCAAAHRRNTRPACQRYSRRPH